MYAVVEIKGFQYKVEKGSKLSVSNLDLKKGSKVSFDKVLFLKDKDGVKFDDKALKDVSVEAKILSHLRDEKVIVFKKKRRKGYQKKTGHRQNLTNIEITDIGLKGKSTETKAKVKAKTDVKAKVEVKAKTEAKVKPKVEVKTKTEVKTEAKAKPKTVTKAKTSVAEKKIDTKTKK